MADQPTKKPDGTDGTEKLKATPIQSDVSFAVVKDRSSLANKGLEINVFVRVYVGPKGSRRFAGELRMKDHEYALLAKGSYQIEPVVL